MKIFGIGIRIVLIFSFTLYMSDLSGQSCPCLSTKCGDIIAKFELEGNVTEVCDGHEFNVTNNTDPSNVDEYIWIWGDGTIDTYTTNQNVTHTYDIADSLVCGNENSVFTICLLIIKNCGDDMSCHNLSTPVGVKHRPKAIFNVDSQGCLDEPLLF
ncbi:MAG: hypothetical protein V3V14_08715 [Saprospiraceae bacterium]